MSYSTFSNESTESLNTASSTASPCSVRMIKSRSSLQSFANSVQLPNDDEDEEEDSKTPTGATRNRDSSAPSSPHATAAASFRMARDPMSVPNFSEAANLHKSNSLDEEDGDRNHLLEQAANALARTTTKDDAVDGLELARIAARQMAKENSCGSGSSGGTPPTSFSSDEGGGGGKADRVIKPSDSAYTFQSYDCSSRSSTLSSQASSSACGNNKDAIRQQQEEEVVERDDDVGLRTSASVNKGFDMGAGGGKEVEEAAAFYANQEFASLSSEFIYLIYCLCVSIKFGLYLNVLAGYESLDGADQRTSAAVSELGEDDIGLLSFSNPHYLGPDVKALLDRRRADRANCLLRDESHQSFAQALNSPADSLFSDYQVSCQCCA